MNNNDLNGLTNALLTAFLDRAASSEVGAICAEFGVIPGSKIFHKAADRAIEWMENSEYDLLDDSNRDKLTQQGLSNLAAQHGAVLGKDYSKTHDGYVFSSELMAKITADIPPHDLEMLKSKGQIKTVSNDAYAMLDKHLEVPFFDSLLGVIAIRFKTLSDTETDRYISTLIEGMGLANPFLEDGLFFHKVFRLLGDRFESIMSEGNSLNDSNPDIPCKVWCDLLTAMGVLDLKIDDNNVFWISESNLRSLDKVWHGLTKRPALIADRMASKG